MKIIYSTIIILLILILTLGIYLNRSYAFIYHEINTTDLRSPDIKHIYTMIGKNQNQATPVSYFALGDSLTAGVGVENFNQAYPYLVAEKLALGGSTVTLKNLASSGAKTNDLIINQLPVAITGQPDVITLLIGVNDIHGNISQATFKKNYDKILKQLSQNANTEIYVISIPYIGSSQLLWPPYKFYFNYKTKQFNKIIQALATDYNINYIDIYTPTVNLFMKPGSHYSSDAFHPSSQGYQLWAQILYDSFN